MRMIYVFLSVVAWAGMAWGASVEVKAIGDQGWKADDTRDATGAQLVGVNYTHYGVPGQTPSAAHDAAIAQQIQFDVNGPGGKGALKLVKKSGTGLGKCTLSTINPLGFDADDWGTRFTCRYAYYTDTTNETAQIKIGVRSTLWGTGAGQSQNGFTATRSGESAWDLVLVHWLDVPTANSWVTVDQNTVKWAIYRQAGNSFFYGIGDKKTFSEWVSDTTTMVTATTTLHDALFGPGAKAVSVQLGVGSSAGNSTTYIDWLETNLLNGGERVDFVKDTGQVVVDFETTSGYTLAADGSGAVSRSTEQPHAGSYSAKMVLPSGSADFAKIIVPVQAKMGATNGQFWCYIPAGSPSSLAPYMYLGIDSNSNGVFDFTGSNSGDSFVIAFVTGGSSYPTDTWFQAGLDGSTMVHVVGNRTGLGASEYSSSGTQGTLASLRARTFSGATTWGDLMTVQVRVGAGEWPGVGAYTAYVDDIQLNINNVLYLVPAPASLYMKPGESCVVSLNVANLQQK